MKKLLLFVTVYFLSISCVYQDKIKRDKEKIKRDSLRVYFYKYNQDFNRVMGTCDAYLLDPDVSLKNLEKAIIYKDSMTYFRNKSKEIYSQMYPKSVK